MASYDQLRDAWLNKRSEYLLFIERCVAKNIRAFKNSSFYADVFDQMFKNEAVSPLGLKALEYVQAFKLKVRKEFEEESKPVFSRYAEVFF